MFGLLRRECANESDQPDTLVHPVRVGHRRMGEIFADATNTPIAPHLNKNGYDSKSWRKDGEKKEANREGSKKRKKQKENFDDVRRFWKRAPSVTHRTPFFYLGNPQMGRNKIEIVPILDGRRRRATYSKRRQGLTKKARELAIMTGVSITLTFEFKGGKVSHEQFGVPTNSFPHPQCNVSNLAKRLNAPSPVRGACSAVRHGTRSAVKHGIRSAIMHPPPASGGTDPVGAVAADPARPGVEPDKDTEDDWDIIDNMVMLSSTVPLNDPPPSVRSSPAEAPLEPPTAHLGALLGMEYPSFAFSQGVACIPE